MNIRKRVVGVIAALAMLAAGEGIANTALAADNADTPTEFTAGSDYGVMKALELMQQLNELRQTPRTQLTPEQIAEAQRVDNGSTMQASQVAANTADGNPVDPINVNWDMMQWAQTRADELAAQGTIDHNNMYNGVPSWYATSGRHNLTQGPDYQSGTYYFGPEALAYARTSAGGYSGNAITSWYSELGAFAGEDRQGYGHYLTEVSPLANIAGMGVAVKNGITITVLEIGYNDGSQDEKTQTVEEAIADRTGSTQPTDPEAESVDPVTATTVEGQAPALPGKVTVRYSDDSTKELPVTWESHDWANQQPGTVTLTGTIDGIDLQAKATVTVTSKAIESVALSQDSLTIDSTNTGDINGLDGITATVTYNNGTSATRTVDWQPTDENIDTVKSRDGGEFTLTGTVEGHKVELHVTVKPATIVDAQAQSGVSVPAGIMPTDDQLNPVTVHWSNGDTTQEDATWELTAGDYTKPDTTITMTGTLQNGATVAAEVAVTDAVPVRVANSDLGAVSIIATHAPNLDDTPAAVVFSDGSWRDLPVAWEPIDPSQYAADKANTSFTVTGTVSMGDWEGTVTVMVNVLPRTLVSATVDQDTLTIASGTDPAGELSKIGATGTYNDGTTEPVSVQWDVVPSSTYANRAGGDYTVHGIAGTYPVVLTLHVEPAYLTAVQADFPDITVIAGNEPTLPQTANVTYSNGDTDVLPITWDVSGAKFDTVGEYTVTANPIDGWDGALPTLTVYVVGSATTIVDVADPAGVTVESGTDAADVVLPATVQATFGDGHTGNVPVMWGALTDAQVKTLASRAGGSFTVNGSVEGTDKTVAVTVTVNPATVRGAGFGEGDDPAQTTTAAVAIESGADVTLPATANVLWSNGDVTAEKITWDALTDAQLAIAASREGGVFAVRGTVEGQTVQASVTVAHATAESLADANGFKDGKVSVTTDPGAAPVLPGSVEVRWSNGDVTTQTVVWDSIDQDSYAQAGASFDVKGTVTVGLNTADGYTRDFGVMATVTVNKVDEGGQEGGDKPSDGADTGKQDQQDQQKQEMANTGSAVMWVVIAVVVLLVLGGVIAVAIRRKRG